MNLPAVNLYRVLNSSQRVHEQINALWSIPLTQQISSSNPFKVLPTHFLGLWFWICAPHRSTRCDRNTPKIPIRRCRSKKRISPMRGSFFPFKIEAGKPQWNDCAEHLSCITQDFVTCTGRPRKVKQGQLSKFPTNEWAEKIGNFLTAPSEQLPKMKVTFLVWVGDKYNRANSKIGPINITATRCENFPLKRSCSKAGSFSV